VDTHQHYFEEVVTLDGAGFERVCACGEVAVSEVEESEKLNGCMSLQEFMNVRYGPSTPIFLESFLLPTFAQVKCRDRFRDVKILSKLRIYTNLLRLCEQQAIPKTYAQEAMRLLLKSGKGLHSKYEFIKKLIEAIQEEPRLNNRVPALKDMLQQPRRKGKQAKIDQVFEQGVPLGESVES
jgi:hypothetical protein